MSTSSRADTHRSRCETRSWQVTFQMCARLDAGHDPRAIEREQTLLLTAVRSDNRAIAKLLIERGADPNQARPTRYASVLHYLAGGTRRARPGALPPVQASFHLD